MDGARQTFGRYEIVRPLGAGGMGEILLARQPGLPGVQRLVVLKKILPHLAQEPGFLDRFLDESRVAASLSHGNIVQVFEAGECDGEYFMAMEYVDGMDLKEAFHRLRSTGRRMPEDLALYVLVEVAKALSYAHEKRGPDGTPLGIVHRDVSPANLLLSLDGQVKLADFGVAKAAMRLSLTLPGTLHGKVFYMSPEQVEGGECDPRSDVFSLGVVAYEMLAGRRPFEGTSEIAVLDLVRRCDPAPLADVAPWVPGSLASIVARALAREPADRYPTMEAFRQALSTYLLEAHTMVSARTLADFLVGLRAAGPSRPPSAATPVPARPGAARSLDEVAAELLGRPAAPVVATTTATSEGPGASHTRTLATPSDAPRSPRRGWLQRAWPWLAVGTGIAGLAAIGWAWSVVNGIRSERVDEAVVAIADVPSPGAGPAAEVAVPAFAPRAPAAAEATAPSAPPPADADRATAVAGPGRSPATAAVEPPAPRKVLLKSDPPGATVRWGDRELGRTPLDVTVPPGGPLRLELSAEGRGAKPVVLTGASPSTVHVALPPEPGRVKFRFFPADAIVRIDDRRIETTGNLVDLELSAGPHVLALESADGQRRRETPFDVAPGRERALGTLELGGEGPSGTATAPPPTTETP